MTSFPSLIERFFLPAMIGCLMLHFHLQNRQRFFVIYSLKKVVIFCIKENYHFMMKTFIKVKGGLQKAKEK